MSSEDDCRIECKYGSKCYQKNSSHHNKYKHTGKKMNSPDISLSPKKQKMDKIVEDNNDSTENKYSKYEKNLDNVYLSNSLSSTSGSLDEKKLFIKNVFLVEMPNDFYLFWDFCKELSKQKPKEAFKSVGLILVGPYDILDDTCRISDENKDKFVLHWRYYYDPPEYQTVIKGDDTSGFHIGYFRDSPNETPAFVGSNRANKDCIIHQMGENIFGAISNYLDDMLKSADPFKKMAINKLQKSLNIKAKELNMNLDKMTSAMQTRQRKSVCKTFHTAGMVVPYNRKTEIGYRKLPVDDKELRKLLDKVSRTFPDKGSEAFTALQPVLTAATIANDECDFGTGLELGINIFCYGNNCFNNTVSRLLNTTYTLLNKHVFGQIVDLHVKHRKKGKPYVLELN